ncbi:xanthine dehydrogenase family protein molybdopterin-binding subunit [Aliiglaciecola lipolytica]|uniref:xanthine dehydrogenase family protein molybdopterin-binding subunit n=1 Tax=Aliiglaciecola lipolytica TaxID=477689 RepID=UPI001C07F3C5|nr:molybdopterin cofactor-binding domain-containing protein [Aliiglaciecola lipolytica]MBU2876245.1 molybdopterin-dependent oxidoreductase [Aliiglaciecola lipolytica]
MNHKIENVSRRQFLKVSGIGASSFVLASSLAGYKPVWAQTSQADVELNLFVSIQSDNRVNIICHRSEMGQGIRTSIPQVVAEELCADWDLVSVVQGLANKEYGSQNTDGSRSIRNFYTILRRMGASARTMLEQAAADLWKVDVNSVYAEDSYVHHKDSKRKVSFGYIAEAAGKLSPPKAETLTYKSKKDFKLIGKPVTGIDSAEIVTGQAEFGQDVRLESMVYASIERSKVLRATVKSFDADAAKSVKGVIDTIQMPDQPLPVMFHPMNGVAVIADSTWAALQGRKALNIDWELGENAAHTSADYIAELKSRIVSKGKPIRVEGDVYADIEQATDTHSATYSVPYLSQAPMEPPAATAVFKNGICEIWACTQSPQVTQQNVAQALGIESDKVIINVTFLGGAFGRKAKPDYSIEAALLAKQLNRPVKVVWSREDDIQQGFYHAVSVLHMAAAMDAKKQITSWLQRTAFPSIMWTFTGTVDEPQMNELSLGFGDLPFAVDNLSCETHKATGHIRIGWMRSVCNIQHSFAQGSFVDELASKAGISTYKMWHQLLGENRLVDPKTDDFDYQNYGEPQDVFPVDIKRIKHALDVVIAKSGADQPTQENEGWGICVHRSFVSYCAVATKVKVVDNKVTVLEMHSSIDAGTVVNPDRVRAQQEGSMIFGLSLALLGEISTKDGAVEQSNYHDYQVLRMHQCPKIETYIIESDAPPGGVGEPGTPPVAASVANAIFHACGKRIRDLPIKNYMSV